MADMKHSEDEEKPDSTPVMVEEKQIQAHNVTLAKILQESKPNPLGAGYLRLYCICGLLYLCSTMNGTSPDSFNNVTR